MSTTDQTAARGRTDTETTKPNASRSREEALEQQWVERGFLAPGKLTEAQAAYQDGLQRSVRPRTIHQTFLVGQAAWAMARMEHTPLVEEQARQIESLRAQTTWDEDRAAAAAKLGDRLLARPARVVGELRATAQGAAWLIDQWNLLKTALDDTGAWNEEQRQRAGALLGIPIEDQPFDPRIRNLTTADACRALARGESERLTDYKHDVLDDWDARERLMAVQGVLFDNSSDAWRMRRYEHSCFQKLLWAEKMLERIDAGSSGLLWTARRGSEASTKAGDPVQSPDHGSVQPPDPETSRPAAKPERPAAEPTASAASEPVEPTVTKRSQSTETQFDKDLQEAIRCATDPVARTLANLNDPASARTLKHGASLVPPGLAPRKANRRNGRKAR